MIKFKQQRSSLLVKNKKGGTMPWHNGDYPPSYKNQPKKIRDKATEIANEVLKTTGNEGEAIATGRRVCILRIWKRRTIKMILK